MWRVVSSMTRAGDRGTSELGIRRALSGNWMSCSAVTTADRSRAREGASGGATRDRRPGDIAFEPPHNGPSPGIARSGSPTATTSGRYPAAVALSAAANAASFSMVADPPGCRGSRIRSSSPSRKSALLEPEARSGLSGSDAHSGRARSTRARTRLRSIKNSSSCSGSVTLPTPSATRHRCRPDIRLLDGRSVARLRH